MGFPSYLEIEFTLRYRLVSFWIFFQNFNLLIAFFVYNTSTFFNVFSFSVSFLLFSLFCFVFDVLSWILSYWVEVLFIIPLSYLNVLACSISFTNYHYVINGCGYDVLHCRYTSFIWLTSISTFSRWVSSVFSKNIILSA